METADPDLELSKNPIMAISMPIWFPKNWGQPEHLVSEKEEKEKEDISAGKMWTLA